MRFTSCIVIILMKDIVKERPKRVESDIVGI